MMMMRNAAVARHLWFNMVVECGCPAHWRWHAEMIRKVYGW